MSKPTPKFDIYQEITDHILEMLEQDIVPWHMPWKRSGAQDLPCLSWPRNATTGRGYNGINVLLLWMAADKRGYDDPRWMTYRQCAGLGGHVRKGEKGARITFWKAYKDKDDEKKQRMVLRTFTVFNLAQCDNVPLDKLPEPVVPHAIEAPPGQEAAAAAVEATGATILHGGNRACFSPPQDLIMMPMPEQFESPDAYWSTLLHELTHWTGHSSRLERTFGAFGSHDYAREELVAEMGSAFLCAQLGIPLEGLQHPQYLASWIEVLKEDKRAILRAASLARKAAEHILGASTSDEAAA